MCNGPGNLEVAPTWLLDSLLTTVLPKNDRCALLNSSLLVSTFSLFSLTCLSHGIYLISPCIEVIFMLTLCSLGDYEASEGKDGPSILAIWANWLYSVIYSPVESRRIKVVFYGFLDNCSKAHTHMCVHTRAHPRMHMHTLKALLNSCNPVQEKSGRPHERTEALGETAFLKLHTVSLLELPVEPFPQVDHTLATAAFSRFP